ncbi:Eco57I restriction-modification methylase domain-containing protein [Rhodanobacter denitrificans]|nr:Eco57I restriction-modification methylase domain-containing protein [Rhodanobacter denitrificans]
MVIPIARLKFYRRAQALESLIRVGQTPSRLMRILIYLWQKSSYPNLLPERAPWASSSLISNPSVNEFVDWLRQQPFEEAAYWLATLYSRLVDRSVRSERAMFFTPPLLAQRVIDDLQCNGASIIEHKWHDPACGGSAFLVPLALRMKKELGRRKLPAKEQLKKIERNLSGNDLDEELLELSSSLLQMALYPLIEASGYVPNFKLSNGDGLGLGDVAARKYDVVICNPPYRKLRSEEAEHYRDGYGDIMGGQPNIYGLFIRQGLRLCRTGGLVGLLTPTSFLSGRSFFKLRKHLICEASILQFDMLGNRTSMFIDVLQETTISVLKAQKVPESAERNAKVSVLTDDGKFSDVGRCWLPSNGDPWPIPRTESDASLLRLAEKAKFSLSDYGYVAKVGHLVPFRDARRRFKEYPKSKSVTKTIVPLVWATDVAPNGEFKHGRDLKNKQNEAFVEVGSLKGQGVVCQAAVLLQRLTSSDQRSRLVAAPVPANWVKKHGGFVCENHVISLLKKEDSLVPVETMAKILNSQPVDRVFRSISSANNVGISELNKLMLPTPTEVLRLLAAGTDVDRAVLLAYGGG